MIFALEPNGFCVAYVINGLYAGFCFAYVESTTCKNLFITACVQVGETVTELKLTAVNGNAAVAASMTLSEGDTTRAISSTSLWSSSACNAS